MRVALFEATRFFVSSIRHGKLLEGYLSDLWTSISNEGLHYIAKDLPNSADRREQKEGLRILNVCLFWSSELK